MTSLLLLGAAAPQTQAQVCRVPENLLAAPFDVGRLTLSGPPSLPLPWQRQITPFVSQDGDGLFQLEDNNPAAHEGISQDVYFASSEPFVTAQIRVPIDPQAATFPGITLLIGTRNSLITIDTRNCSASWYHPVHVPHASGAVREPGYCRAWVTAANPQAQTSARFTIHPAVNDTTVAAWSGAVMGSQSFRDPVVELAEAPTDLTPPALAGSEGAGIVVRQYSGQYTNPLIANPGPGVTGIHLLTTALEVSQLQPSYAQDLAAVRASGLRAYPGFRMAAPASLCVDAAHWSAMAALLVAVHDLSEADEMLVFDGESYSGPECSDGYLALQGWTYQQLLDAMQPFLEVIAARGMRIGYYPANSEDAVMRAMFDAAGDGSEAWFESTYQDPLEHVLDRRRLQVRSGQVMAAWNRIQRRHPDAHMRSGYDDDLLREHGDEFRNSDDRNARAWVFDYTRSDRLEWGTPDWRSGITMSALNEGVSNVWTLQSWAMDLTPDDAVGGVDMTARWGHGRWAAGYGQPEQIRRNGWGPGLEWSADATLTDPAGPQTYSVSVIFDSLDEDRPILSGWESHPTNNSFRLWLDQGEVVLDVYSANGATTRIPVDVTPSLGVEERYIFGFDGTTVRIVGQSDVTLSSPVANGTRLRIAALRTASSGPIQLLFSGDMVYTRALVRWVGSSRVDLQACKLEYSIVSPK